jgi:hypothetical protein
MHHEVLNLERIAVLLILIVLVSFHDICKEGPSHLYRMEQVPVNLAMLHHANASYTFNAKCLEQFDDSLEQLQEYLEQLAESLRVWLSPCVFGRVPVWHVNSFPGEGSDLESLHVRPNP